MALTLVNAMGEQHGLLASLPNSVPFDDFKNYAPELREKLRKEKKENDRLVKVRYINHQEQARGRFEQPYVTPGEPIQIWRLIHDHEYTLPYGFVKQINDLRGVQREGLQSVDGKEVQNSGAPIQRDKPMRIHECVPVSFK